MTRAILALGLALALAGCRPGGGEPTHHAATATIGGPFQLVDTERRVVSDRTLRGKPTAIFFGFTYCPEVCPTTLAAMSQALAELGPQATRFNTVFVSVDPERDTPAAMKEYLSNFDPRIRGFTGTPAQVERIAKAYRVYYRKVPIGDDSYTVDHSTAVYLFDADGAFIEPIRYGAPPNEIAGRMSALLSRPEPAQDPLEALRRFTRYCVERVTS